MKLDLRELRKSEFTSRCRLQAAFGLAVWGVGAALAGSGAAPGGAGLGGALLLLGPLVAVPLALPLTVPAWPRDRVRGPWRLAAAAELPAALALIASFALPAGRSAALLAVPWLSVTMLLALLGLLRFAERGPWPLSSLGIDAGLAFIAVGGVWTAFSRAGTGFLGFTEPVVLLTGAHFHFAGFALPVLTGLLGRAVPGRQALMALWGVITGVPLLALGITLAPRGFPLIELLAALWMAAAAAVAGILQIRFAARRSSWVESAVLTLGGVSLIGAMVLAAAYAAGRFLGAPLIDIPAMVLTHAVANVFGFALPGLLVWNIAAGRQTVEAGASGEEVPQILILLPWLGDRLLLSEWEQRDFSMGSEGPPPAGVDRDRSEFVVGAEPAGPPLEDGPYREAATAILRYDIFPRRVLEAARSAERLVEGATVAGRYRLLPGVEIALGARVVETFDAADGDVRRTGFTYRTLDGHPFVGEETFSVEKCLGSGEVRVVMRSWSRPAAFWARRLRPLVRYLQRRAVRAALHHLEELSRDRQE